MISDVASGINGSRSICAKSQIWRISTDLETLISNTMRGASKCMVTHLVAGHDIYGFLLIRSMDAQLLEFEDFINSIKWIRCRRFSTKDQDLPRRISVQMCAQVAQSAGHYVEASGAAAHQLQVHPARQSCRHHAASPALTAQAIERTAPAQSVKNQCNAKP